MADQTIEQRQAAVPQTIGPGTKVATMVAGVTGGADFDAIDGDKLPIAYEPEHYTRTDAPTEVDDVARLTAHLAGIDAKLGTITTDDCCTALGAYEPTNYTVGEQTPAAQLAGIDAALAPSAGGAVRQDANGDAEVVRDLDVGRHLTAVETLSAADGDFTVAATGELTIANPGTPAGPALEIDRGEGGPLGVYSPGEHQIGLVANEKPVILDGGTASVLRPATDGLLSLGTEAIQWATAWAQTVRASAGLILGTGTSGDKAISIYQSETSASGSGGVAKLYTKAVEGVAHLFARGASGDEVQLTGAAVPGGGPATPTTISASTATISDSAQSPGVHDRMFLFTHDAGAITVTFGTATAGSRCELHFEAAVYVGFAVSGVTYTFRSGLTDEIGTGPASVYVKWLTSTTLHLSGELDVL